jgi:hypothetical protein
MRKTFFFALLIAVISCSKSPAPQIDFYKENVVIDILKDQVSVVGIYYMKNLTKADKKVKFFYPFPVDSFQAYPDLILIDYPFDKDKEGIYFDMSFPARRVDSFKVLYQQKLKGRQCRYITLTTRQWQRPIQDAAFTVVAPGFLKLKINYPVVGKETINDTVFYYIRMKKFYPGADLEIKW